MSKKRLFSLVCILLFVISLSVEAFATETQDPTTETSSNTRAIRDFNYTISDSDGNRYSIIGFVYQGSTAAFAQTRFAVSHVASGEAGDEEDLAGGLKNLKASGTVTTYNSTALTYATTEIHGTVEPKTGLSGFVEGNSKVLIYPIVSIAGLHYFAFPAQSVTVNGTSSR